MRKGATIAFQPIVDIRHQSVFAQEALIGGQSDVDAPALPRADVHPRQVDVNQAFRRAAFAHAQDLMLLDATPRLAIDMLPDRGGSAAAALDDTVAAANEAGIPPARVILEFADAEDQDIDRTAALFRTCRSAGFGITLDAFGPTAFSLSLLDRCPPDNAKIGASLVRGVDAKAVNRRVLDRAVRQLTDLGVRPICADVISAEELAVLLDLGVELAQGPLFGRPSPGEPAPFLFPDRPSGCVADDAATEPR